MFCLGSVRKRGWLWFVATLFLVNQCVFSQTLLLDRGVPPGDNARTAEPAPGAAGGSLVGDDFTIGREGEIWVIDRIRTWVSASTASSTDLGALFQEITFLGGLANDPPAPECALHN